jgi:hypothetical protein
LREQGERWFLAGITLHALFPDPNDRAERADVVLADGLQVKQGIAF